MDIKEVKFGRTTRKDFSKVGDYIEMPNLIKVQKDSYDWFVEEGLGEVLKDISPIVDYSGNLVLEFFDYYMEDKTKYTQEEAKERDATYSTRLHVKVRLINRESGEIKEQEIYLGDFPLMTDSGTFIINGAERVVVSQLVRSPGCYYDEVFDTKTGRKTYTSTVMPLRGAWIEYETDGNDMFWVRVDRTRKIPVTTLLRAIGLVSDDQIRSLFGEENLLETTIQKDPIKTSEDALIEIYKKLRPGELPTVEAARSLFNGLFFDNRRYDLAKVGRFKFNQKLSIANRIKNQVAFSDIMDKETGEVFVTAGEIITPEVAEDIQNAGINIVDIKIGEKKIRVIGNGIVNIHKVLPNVDLSSLHFKEDVNYEVLKNIMENTSEEDLVSTIKERYDELVPKHITTEDITMVASDGHKLVRCKTLAAKGNERAAFILPKKPATLLKNLLPKEQGTVTIEFDERNAVFMLESYRMVCRLIEGRYPNYNSVIPQNNPHKVTVDRQQLIGALRRVSIFSSQASSLIKLRMQENQIVISAQDIDFSTSAEETQVCQYSGAAMSIGFKSTFLIDILNNISADEVVIELADPSRAGVIVPVEQEENEDLLMLLMPMMLND